MVRPLPSWCIFQVISEVIFQVIYRVQFRWPDRRRDTSNKMAKGPALGRALILAEANGLLVLLVRLFVGGLRTARILTLLLRAARVLALLLRINWIGRLRGFVGALLRI